MASISQVSIILASDGIVNAVHNCYNVMTAVSPVVYDNSLTDAFFTCLVYLHSIILQPPTTLISLEKRLAKVLYSSSFP